MNNNSRQTNLYDFFRPNSNSYVSYLERTLLEERIKVDHLKEKIEELENANTVSYIDDEEEEEDNGNNNSLVVTSAQDKNNSTKKHRKSYKLYFKLSCIYKFDETNNYYKTAKEVGVNHSILIKWVAQREEILNRVNLKQGTKKRLPGGGRPV